MKAMLYSFRYYPPPKPNHFKLQICFLKKKFKKNNNKKKSDIYENEKYGKIRTTFLNTHFPPNLIFS